MEWDHDACLRLVEEYEKVPVLWDTRHSNYYSKAKKQEAWETVATLLNSDIDELKKKMNSLLGSFRRERAKHRRHVMLGREYLSKWFAYEKMKFLLDLREDRDDGETSTYENVEDDHYQNDDETKVFIETSESSNLLASAVETTLSLPNGSYKRQKVEEENYVLSPQVSDPAYVNSSGYDYCGDEFEALGKIVAVKVRNMQVNQRIVAEKLINDVLYYGQMENLSANSCIRLNDETSTACILSNDEPGQ